MRAPCPPAVSGSGAKGAGARAKQWEAPGKPRTAVPANPDRELRWRAALGLPTRCARRAVRYAHRVPARGAHAPGARRSKREARAKRRNETAEAEPSDQPARETRTASSEGARRSDSPRAVRVASRVACTARPLVIRRAPAGMRADQGSAARGATEREKKRGEERRREHHTRDVRARLRRREPPVTHARRAHRLRVARRDARW